MARSKIPHELKVVAGTDRPDRKSDEGVDLPLVDKVPPAPDWLPNVHAKKEFKRLAAILHANRLLTEGGLMSLGHLCALHGKLVQLWSAGESPSGHLLSQYRNLINDFGLTPVSQGKVKPGAGAENSGNKFATNGKRGA